MREPNDRTAQPVAKGAEHTQLETPNRSRVSRNMDLDRPIGVMVIAALNMVVGALAFIVALPPIMRWMTYSDVSPEHYAERNSAIVSGVLGYLALPFAALFILATVGLWMRRKWGLRLALASSIIFFLTGLLWLLSAINQFFATTVGSGEGLAVLAIMLPLGVLLMSLGAGMFIYLRRQAVRAHFR